MGAGTRGGLALRRRSADAAGLGLEELKAVYAARQVDLQPRSRVDVLAARDEERERERVGMVPTPQKSQCRTIFRILALITFAFVWGVQAVAADGLVTVKSTLGPKETMNKLEAEVKAKGLTVFARIDHAAGANEAGLSMRPTEVLIFGNAKGGTPLMQSTQTIGIDLPLKALVWQDEAGTTWLSYNDPSWLAKRHGLGQEVEAVVNGMTATLAALAKAATAHP
jgi:uncharacterized protein (DUF302 family)